MKNQVKKIIAWLLLFTMNITLFRGFIPINNVQASETIISDGIEDLVEVLESSIIKGYGTVTLTMFFNYNNIL